MRRWRKFHSWLTCSHWKEILVFRDINFLCTVHASSLFRHRTLRWESKHFQFRLLLGVFMIEGVANVRVTSHQLISILWNCVLHLFVFIETKYKRNWVLYNNFDFIFKLDEKEFNKFLLLPPWILCFGCIQMFVACNLTPKPRWNSYRLRPHCFRRNCQLKSASSYTRPLEETKEIAFLNMNL